MSLFTTHSAANRVVSQDLSTHWKRETIQYPITTSVSGTLPVYKYTRYRTKTYAYVGMTRAAAETCAAAMMALWNRGINPQVLPARITPEGQFSRKYSSIIPVSTVEDLEYKQCATITTNRAGGDAWTVDINVNEELEFYMSYKNDEGYYSLQPWTEFQSNPNIVTDNFKGWRLRSTDPYDFDYDEGV